MADDTFLLISRGVRYSPGVVYNPQMLPIIVDAAMTGVLVQHRSAKNSQTPHSLQVHSPIRAVNLWETTLQTHCLDPVQKSGAFSGHTGRAQAAIGINACIDSAVWGSQGVAFTLHAHITPSMFPHNTTQVPTAS